jgi:hypothetical protein
MESALMVAINTFMRDVIVPGKYWIKFCVKETKERFIDNRCSQF